LIGLNLIPQSGRGDSCISVKTKDRWQALKLEAKECVCLGGWVRLTTAFFTWAQVQTLGSLGEMSVGVIRACFFAHFRSV